MKWLTVIICTHNPRQDFLDRSVDSLTCQSLNKDLWELLVIDNASDKPIIFQNKKKLPDTKIIKEKHIGLLFARLAGIKNSNGNLIIFVDDDNVLAHNYLEESIKISKYHPNLGCFGAGIIEPEFETPIPEYLISHQEMLALRKIDTDFWSNNPRDRIIPWGAGIVVRRDVALSYCHEMEKEGIWQVLGRNGNKLLSSEDVEFSWIACKMGYGKGLFVDLKLTHLIDRRRLTEDYFINLAEGHAFSNRILDFIHRIKHQDIRLAYTNLNEVFLYLFKLEFHKFFVHLYRFIIFMNKTKTNKNIAKAWWRGHINAENFIKFNLK